MEGGGKGSGVVPDAVMEAVKRTTHNMSEFKSQFVEFLSLCDPDVLADLPPLQRAKSLLLLAKATTTLFTLRLRCNGIHPDDHAVKSEIERLSLYQDKLERFINLSKDQRQSMRDISKGEGPKMKYLERSVHKKRKCQPSEKQSVRAATQEFLEKAARELLGDNRSGIKGPLQPNTSYEHDQSSD
ncbi:hypothetical protein RHMOL_Rhmol07G0212600 [Rhododendron molle]|uniref:Uncharacterized protein n=1 Tax=Rhododendron molle TaxID=49168 RepID=A0ACC0N448_RHOML|nr:hypothetical protein RHMOL_Rhmol07G0212600 [Rhododendron molle]